MTWKQVECPFERDRKVLQYLLSVPVFSEDGESLACTCPRCPQMNAGTWLPLVNDARPLS